jgi:hypothetical protein
MDCILPIKKDIPYLDTNVIDIVLENWNATTSYTQGTEIIYQKSVYYANNIGADNENIGKIPSDRNTVNVNGIDIVYWIFKRTLNSYRCFDDENNTQTTMNGMDINYLIDSSRITDIIFFGLEAKSLDILMYQDNNNEIFGLSESLLNGEHDNLIKKYSIDLIDDNIQDIIEYINESWTYKEKYALSLPFTIGTTKMVISIKQDNNISKIGNIIIGTKINLGVTLDGIGHNEIDFGTTQINEDGSISRIAGNVVDLLSLNVSVVDTGRSVKDYDIVVKRLASFSKVNMVWIGCSEYETLTVFGFLKESRKTLRNANTTLELEIQGIA